MSGKSSQEGYFVKEYAHDISVIDSGYLKPNNAAMYIIREGMEVCIVEAPSHHGVARTIEVLKRMGLGPEHVVYVFVTHVHLDHAGGAGALLEALPKAKLVVHPSGAKHMIDPSRLVQAARSVYPPADQEKYIGRVVPAPAERVVESKDDEEYPIGDGNAKRVLRVVHTPGHAYHHQVVFDERSGAVFTGDMCGISYLFLQRPLESIPLESVGECPSMLLLPSAPTQFDPGAWHSSIDKVLALEPEQFWPTHFGPMPGKPASIGVFLKASLNEYEVWGQDAIKTFGSNKEDVYRFIVDRLRQFWHRGACDRGVAMEGDEGERVFTEQCKDEIDIAAQGIAYWALKRARLNTVP